MPQKITNILISILLIAGISTLIVYATSTMIQSYGSTPLDNSTFAAYNQYQAVNSSLDQIKEKTTSMTAKSGLFDWLGGFFTQGYQAAVLTKNSIGLTGAIVQTASSSVPLDDYSRSIINQISLAIIIVIIILGVFLAWILKWPV
jgi:hypothetical protein